MTPKARWMSILVVGILVIGDSRAFSAVKAVSGDSEPGTYLPLLSAAGSQVAVRSAKPFHNADQATLVQLNTHGALVIGSGGSVEGVPSAASSLMMGGTSVKNADASKIEAVVNRGVLNNRQYFEVYGSFNQGEQLVMDCGVGLLPLPQAPVEYRSATQINISVAPNLLDRECTIRGTSPDTTFDLKVPGLTCEEWSGACPGAVVGVYEKTASDGSMVRIEIRSGTRAGESLSPEEVADIKKYLDYHSPETLKHVRFVQRLSGVSNYISGSTIGNGGGIYVDAGGYFTRDFLFPINYGVGAILYTQLEDEEKAFWKSHYTTWAPEKNFGIRYLDWSKGTISLARTAIDFDTNLPQKPSFASELQQLLVIATHFYDPASNQLRLNFSSPSRETIQFTSDRIQVRDVIYWLDGNMIIGQSRGNRPLQFRYDAPIPIPETFLKVIPRR